MYTATIVPQKTTINKGATATVIVQLTGPVPKHMGVLNTADWNRDVNARFALNPAIAKVVSVVPVQHFGGREEFIWSKTSSAGTEFVWAQRGSYLDPPFDINLGSVYEITLEGVAPGTAIIDLKSFAMGNNPAIPPATLVDGIIEVV